MFQSDERLYSFIMDCFLKHAMSPKCMSAMESEKDFLVPFGLENNALK